MQLLNPNDFVNINGVWEAKRNALIKILSSLPLSYAWEIKEKELTSTYANITGVLAITTGNIIRSADSMDMWDEWTKRSEINAFYECKSWKKSFEKSDRSAVWQCD